MPDSSSGPSGPPITWEGRPLVCDLEHFFLINFSFHLGMPQAEILKQWHFSHLGLAPTWSFLCPPRRSSLTACSPTCHLLRLFPCVLPLPQENCQQSSFSKPTWATTQSLGCPRQSLSHCPQLPSEVSSPSLQSHLPYPFLKLPPAVPELSLAPLGHLYPLPAPSWSLQKPSP